MMLYKNMEGFSKDDTIRSYTCRMRIFLSGRYIKGDACMNNYDDLN
jgi:hypothetical protein